MADDSSSTAISAPNPSDVVINVEPDFGRPGGQERLRCIIKDALVRGRVQFVAGIGEIAKTLFVLDFGGVLSIPATFNAHFLPKSHLCLISFLLLAGALSLFLAIALRNNASELAATSGLIGTACVVTVLPIIATGAFPMLGFLTWVFVLLLVGVILCALWVHPASADSAQVVDEKGIAE